jgi:tetratricopeptide (TPR) repeat protein
MRNSTICLALMMKSESHILSRLLSSVKPHIDCYAVLDTGSTDDSIEIVRKELADFPGEIAESPFVDFSTSRNQLLELARKQGTDYLACFDADHVLHVEDGALDNLTLDSYLIQLAGPLTYWLPYIHRADKPFAYRSRTHEFLSFQGDDFSQEKLPGVWLDHYGDGGTRSEKFTRDLKLLEEEYDLDPENERTVFYLAQTYSGVGRTEESIAMYQKRIDLGGWQEEIAWSYFQIAEQTHDTRDYLKAWNFRPSRLEPIQRMAKRANEEGQHHVAYMLTSHVMDTPPPTDILFVESWVLEYGLLLEHGLAAYYTGRVEEAKLMFELMLTRDIPDDIRELTIRNLEFCN